MFGATNVNKAKDGQATFRRDPKVATLEGGLRWQKMDPKHHVTITKSASNSSPMTLSILILHLLIEVTLISCLFLLICYRRHRD